MSLSEKQKWEPLAEKMAEKHHKVNFEELMKMRPEETVTWWKYWEPWVIRERFLPWLREAADERPIKLEKWQIIQRKIQLAEHHIVQKTLDKIEESTYGGHANGKKT